jgi:D-xylose transport system substrate-binding protein
MTVYKAIEKEANAAAEIAIALLKGETPDVSDEIDNGKKTIPARFEEPVAVNKDNIKDYLGAVDFPKKEEICTGKLQAKCEELGL